MRPFRYFAWLAFTLAACSSSGSDTGQPTEDAADGTTSLDSATPDSGVADAVSDAAPDADVSGGGDARDSSLADGEAGSACTPVASTGDGTPRTTSWAKRLGGADGTSDTRVFDVFFDKSGNVWVAGNFSGTVNFGGADLVSKGSTDMYFAKFDRDGKHLFSKSLGGSGAILTPFAITADDSGGGFVGGLLRGSASVGGAAFTSTGSGTVAFLARFSASDGSHTWSKSFGGAAEDSVVDLAVSPTDDVVAAVNFIDSIDLGGGALTSAGLTDFALATFTASSGAHVWSKRFGGAKVETVRDIALDGVGNIYAVGSFQGTSSDLGGGPLTTIATGGSPFVGRWSSTGAHVWSQAPSGANDAFFSQIALAPDGDLVLTGAFKGATLGVPGCPLSGVGGYDIVLEKLGTDGVARWAHVFGGKDNDYGRAVTIDAAGTIELAGQFSTSVSFGGTTFTTPSAFSTSPFLAAYRADGAHLRSQAFAVSSPNTISFGAMTTGSGGSTLFAGTFAGTVRVGTIDLTNPWTPTSLSGTSVYLATLAP